MPKPPAQPGQPCPKCQQPLVVESDPPAWCPGCEWNLDAMTPMAGGWFVRSFVRLDRRAGYRADRRLVTESEARLDEAEPRVTPGFVLLAAISGVLVALLLGLLALGGWLIATSGGNLVKIGAGLFVIWLAYLLRPRLGRVRRLLRDKHRVTPEQAPTLHALVNRIADEAGGPRPDIIAFDESWNAAAGVIGLRRTRVLVLGVPLLLAVRGQQLVGLIGHEMGHFRYADNTRGLITYPALTFFGHASQVIRPPAGDAFDRGIGGIFALVYTAWKIGAGAVSWLLFTVHIGLNAIGSRDSRRDELRADLLGARVAGTEAMMATTDRMVLAPMLTRIIQPHPDIQAAMGVWQRAIDQTVDQHTGYLPGLRQLSIRTSSSLLASHPAPGRRHQLLSRLPAAGPGIVVTEELAQRLDAEIRPYVELISRRLADFYR